MGTEVNQRQIHLKRWMAVLAVLNLLLVCFDLTYLSLRSRYLEVVPRLVQLYDPVKGVVPHPETQRYLTQVTRLESQLAGAEPSERNGSPDGSPDASLDILLAELRASSQFLVQDDPFLDRQATLETIRQSLQARTGAESPFAAFDRFWSLDYLTQAGWQPELTFWNRQIRPLLAANYYRRVDRFGQTVDYFWLLDLPFVLLFGLELAIRSGATRRRSPELSWPEAVLRRWYDLFLLLPFWRWLRLLPVAIRLQQVGWLNLELLQAEARRDVAVGFAREITEVVGVQAIDQMQAAVRRGDVMEWLLYPESRRTYLQINDRNQIREALARIGDIVVHQVLPQIKPDVELLVSYNLQYLLEQLPGYRQLKLVPGANRLPRQTSDRLTETLTKQTYQTLVQIWSDPELAERATQLILSFREALAVELRKKSNTAELEELLIELLEEIKLNYVKSLTEVEIEQLVAKTEQISRRLKT